MKISTQCDVLLRNYTEKETIKILADAGYDCIDFSFSKFGVKGILGNSRYAEQASDLRQYAEGLGISFNQAHSTFPTSVGEKEGDEEIFRAVVREMEFASILGAKAIVVHPKHHLEYKTNKKYLKDLNKEFYTSLISYCEKFNIKVALENMWQYDKKRHYIVHSACSSVEEFTEYLDMLDSKWFVACLDIGHCALVDTDITEIITALGHDRLKALHMHDVDFIHDCHTLPGMEKLDYSEVINALKKINYDGEFTLEADNFLIGFEKEFMPEAAKFMAKRIRYLADKME